MKLATERGFDMDVVPFDLFLEFVEYRHKLMSSRFGKLLQKRGDKVVSRFNPGGKVRANAVQTSSNSKPLLCNYCESTEHQIFRCEAFSQISPAERKNVVRQKHLCYNCLGRGHGATSCSSKSRCRVCSGNHHSLLHLYSGERKDKRSSSPAPDSVPASASALSAASATRPGTRLQVLPVCVINHVTGACRNTLALLDSGADCHLMVEGLCAELGFNGTPIRSEMQMVNGMVERYDTVLVDCTVRGASEEENAFLLENVRVVPQMPDVSSSIPSQNDLVRNPHLEGITIPSVPNAEVVKLIIGIASPALHVFSEIRQDGDSSLWAGKTPLGWVLHGRTLATTNNSRCSVNLLVDAHANSLLNSACPCHFDYGKPGDPDTLLPSLDDEEAEKVTKVAGFALRRTIDENASDANTTAVQAVKRDMYVDDLLTSVPDSESAISLARDVVLLLQGGVFDITKFSSNCPEVLKALPPDRLAPHLKEINFQHDELPGHKTLGLVWHPQTDAFTVKVKSF